MTGTDSNPIILVVDDEEAIRSAIGRIRLPTTCILKLQIRTPR